MSVGTRRNDAQGKQTVGFGFELASSQVTSGTVNWYAIVSECMRENLTKLSYRKSNDFWQQFRNVFEMRDWAIGPLRSSDGRLATSKEEIFEELRKKVLPGATPQRNILR